MAPGRFMKARCIDIRCLLAASLAPGRARRELAEEGAALSKASIWDCCDASSVMTPCTGIGSVTGHLLLDLFFMSTS